MRRDDVVDQTRGRARRARVNVVARIEFDHVDERQPPCAGHGGGDGPDFFQGDPEPGRRDLMRGIEQLSQVFDDRDSRAALDGATADVAAGNVYQALRRLRGLLGREARLFAQLS